MYLGAYMCRLIWRGHARRVQSVAEICARLSDRSITANVERLPLVVKAPDDQQYPMLWHHL